MKIFPLISILILLSGCTYDTVTDVCIDKLLIKHNMDRYFGIGEDIWGCEEYLFMYEWKGEPYFESCSNCVDKGAIIPFDCDGNKLSDDFRDSIHQRFAIEATPVGIVGVGWY